MRKQLALNIVVLLFVLTGCTKTWEWTSTPQVSTFDNNYYKAMFEPQRPGRSFYAMFRLEIANRTKKDLKIDWNKTRYLLDGRSNGGFVFEGMDPENIREQTIPEDIVPAGGIFSKEISPYKMLARAPMRSRDRKEGEKAIKFGPLPAGENGILLVVRQDGKAIREKIAVNIKVNEEWRWF